MIKNILCNNNFVNRHNVTKKNVFKKHKNVIK